MGTRQTQDRWGEVRVIGVVETHHLAIRLALGEGAFRLTMPPKPGTMP